jgi:homospermidine synthase
MAREWKWIECCAKKERGNKMSKMIFKWFICFLAVGLSSCATVPISSGPNVYSLSKVEGAPMVVVPQVEDNRVDKKRLGTIGAASFNTESDLAESVTNQLLAQLHGDGFNFERSAYIDSKDINQITEKVSSNNAGGLLYVSLEEVKLFSFDAIMQPTEVNVRLHAMLFDKEGNVLFDDGIQSSVSKRLGLATQGAIAKLVEQALTQSVSDLMKQDEFSNGLKKIKGGESA